MDISSKIMLVFSILLFGYSLSEFFSDYKAVCEKADEFKEMARVHEASEASLRRSSFLMSLGLSAIYTAMTWVSGLALWITVAVALKFILTLLGSDLELVRILRTGVYPKKFYYLSKVDSFFNALLGLCIALFLVL